MMRARRGARRPPRRGGGAGVLRSTSMRRNAALTAALIACSCATAVPAPPAPPPSHASSTPPAGRSAMNYPPSRRVDVKDVLHGIEVPDPYRWLEDGKSPEVQAWMKAQDDFARARLARLPDRDAIAARLKELLYLDALSAPLHRGHNFFYTRRHATKEKSVVYWKSGKEGTEQVLFDPNTWSDDGSVSLGGWYPTRDGTKVAYTVHHNNSDEATLYVTEVATGKKSEIDVIEGAKYAAASWTPRGEGFYYTWLPTDPKIPVADRPGYAELRFHALGTDPRQDALVHERLGDPTSFQVAYVSRDGHWLIRNVGHGWYKQDVYFRDLRRAGSPWRPLSVGRDAMFSVGVWKDRFYVQTNDGAPRWRVLRVDPQHPEREHWKEIVPERADATLDGFDIIGGHLTPRYLKDVASLVEIHDLDGKL